MINLEDNEDYILEEFKDLTFPKKLEDTNFRKCTFINVDFSYTDLSTNYFENCKFTNCDFSNAIFPKFINKGNTYENCKLLGTNLMEVTLESTKFIDCQMKYSNFYLSRFNNVSFSKCNLENASLTSLQKVKKLTFDECNLKECDFFETKLDGLDLRTCDIGGIRVNLEDLKGVIVTGDEAIILATILQIRIKEIGEKIE